MHDKQFPGESEAYREVRNELLREEIELRRHVEAVAAKRRAMPLGGRLKEDYTFDERADDGSIRQVRFSELFRPGKNTLLLYSFMFSPEAKSPCPSCTSIVDGLDGQVHHVEQGFNIVSAARAPIERFAAWGEERGWRRIRLLSSLNNTFNTDYHAEADIRRQMPLMHVFHKTDDGIFHFHTSELLFVPADEGQEPRHVDSIWPLWNLLDLTPDGRGEWNPKLDYGG